MLLKRSGRGAARWVEIFENFVIKYGIFISFFSLANAAVAVALYVFRECDE